MGVCVKTVPYIGVPACWVFGRSKFQGYLLARREDLTETHRIAIQYRSNLVARGLVATPQRRHDLLTETLAMMPFTIGNDAELLVDGETTLSSRGGDVPCLVENEWFSQVILLSCFQSG